MIMLMFRIAGVLGDLPRSLVFNDIRQFGVMLINQKQQKNRLGKPQAQSLIAKVAMNPG